MKRKRQPEEEDMLKGPHPGDDIIVTRQIALDGTARIAALKKVELCSRYPEYFIAGAEHFTEEICIAAEAALAEQSGAGAVYEMGEGGVFAALWNFAERTGAGLDIDLMQIPLKQETVEICEFFDLNPYQLASGGSLLIAAGDGNAVIRAFRAAGVPAVLIGKATNSNDRVLLSEDRRRYIDRPKPDDIWKVMKEEVQDA